MKVVRAAAATADIDWAAEELAVECGAHVANLFLTRLDATAKFVATMPLAFSLVDPPLARHPGLRVVPVKRFTARLIFYTPTATGILVVRVLVASSDLQAILE